MPNEDPKSKQVRVTPLTEMQEKFAQEWVAGGCKTGSGAPCARQAGYKFPKEAAHDLLNSPAVLTRIEELNQQRNGHFSVKMAAAETALSYQGITQEWVMKQTADIASSDDAIDKDKLKALEMLGEWLGMKVNRTADLTDDFKGKSPKELEYFAEHGYWPDETNPDKSRVN